ncbi:hypothetical protein B0H11DRAFT_2280857 [Mycena galericulata]|nr:hypothetical protein B0H11DRAFT_2280857 [Mycena galericulata]
MASVPSTPVKIPSSDTTHSTPHSRTTAHARTLNTAPVASLQSALKKDIADEFGGHIWQFPAKKISRMLSPKRLKTEYTKTLITSGQKGPLHPSLDDHVCLVDDPVVTNAFDEIEVPPSTLKSVGQESQSYQSLCDFLNACGQAINIAYDRLAKAHPSVGEFMLKPITKRWYPQLYFHYNDEHTADGIDSAAPLKPDIVGLHEQVFKPKVKKAWPELIWQAATYARALRSATPERALRLVFGYNQQSCEFRVLIFHNGGLAASLPYDLRSPSGRKDALNMLWPVFLWQDAEDAGFPSFTDGDQLALYRSENMDYIARRVSLLSHSLSCRGRGTLVILGQLTEPRIQAASFIGLQPQICLGGGPRRTRASTQSQTQVSRDLKDQRDTKKTTTLGQKQSGSGGKKPTSSELGKFRKPSSPQPSSPGSQQPPAPPIPANIPQIRSVKYHEEPVAICVPAEFRTLGAAFASEGDLKTLQTPASRFHTAPDGSASPATCVIRISSPTTSGPGPLNETAMASACSGLFGLPITQNWFQGCFRSGQPISSALFEPTNNEKDTRHWAISKNNKVSPNPDHRPMIVCVMEEEGMSLEQCTSAGDLCESILHALLGWLAAYERGWFQRDPSIGNILRLRQDRVQSWGADIKSNEETEEETKSLTEQLDSIHLDPPVSVTVGTWDPERASELKAALVASGRPRVCKAILTDFDLSAYLQDYFAADHSDARSLSGTVEFMSVRLREAFSASERYLQSPLDDLWAFFYTAVWATVFHAHRPSTEVLPMSSQEITWRLNLRSRSADEREGTVKRIVQVKDFEEQLPSMLRAMAPVFKDWQSALDRMQDAWDLDSDQYFAFIGEYYAKFVPSESVECQCGEPFQTREHILRDCEKYDEHRGVLREVSNQISIPDILGTEKGIQALAKFLESSGAFTKTGQPRHETEPLPPEDEEDEHESDAGSEGGYGGDEESGDEGGDED